MLGKQEVANEISSFCQDVMHRCATKKDYIERKRKNLFLIPFFSKLCWRIALVAHNTAQQNGKRKAKSKMK